MTATIRGLTLRHPWPRMFLLDDQPKRIENRDWPAPKHMLGQLIALHGGTLPKASNSAYMAEIRGALDWVSDIFSDADPADILTDEQLVSEFCVGGIYGVARLAEVVTASDDPWFTGPYGWVLIDFVAINPPVIDNDKNHRGLWQIEEKALEQLRERYKAAKTPVIPASAAPLPSAPADPQHEVLARVSRREALTAPDGDTVRALIAAGLMHVTPEFDRTDPCPYRLTEAGRAALRGGGP